MKAILTITEKAATQVKKLMAESPDDGILGLRVGIKTRGCNGLAYFVEYAHERKRFEDVIEDKGVTIFVDPTATMFILGSEMDWVEDKFESKFVFNNPNETGRCGCGESFSVDQAPPAL